ncbi:MAG: hypothetical protein ACI4PW_00700, partial [Alphaproteobacteria bacterium]
QNNGHRSSSFFLYSSEVIVREHTDKNKKEWDTLFLKNRPFPPDRESGAKLFILKPYRTADRKRRKISEHPRPETAEPHQTTTRTLFFPGRRYFPPDRESEIQPLFLFIQSHTAYSIFSGTAGGGVPGIGQAMADHAPSPPQHFSQEESAVRPFFHDDPLLSASLKIRDTASFSIYSKPYRTTGRKQRKTGSIPARNWRSLIRRPCAHCFFPTDVISRAAGNQRHGLFFYLF